MEKEYWTKRKAAWEFFNRWEDGYKWKEYVEMPYSEKIIILKRMLESARNRNPAFFQPFFTLEDWMQRKDFLHYRKLTEKKKLLPSVKT